MCDVYVCFAESRKHTPSIAIVFNREHDPPWDCSSDWRLRGYFTCLVLNLVAKAKEKSLENSRSKWM